MPKKIKKKDIKKKKMETKSSKFSRYNFEFTKILGKLWMRNTSAL